MLKKLHRGLFVIELMGQGINYVTGDYSRGAAGFWVERSPGTCARFSGRSSASVPTPTRWAARRSARS
jgi:hypothetical protein